jgi:hypothetical protein
MARTRELVCIHYKAKGECDLGKDAEFYGLCQTCPSYKKKPGAKPARTDNRRRKLEKYYKHERRDDY